MAERGARTVPSEASRASPALPSFLLAAFLASAASGCATVREDLPPPPAYAPARDTGARALAADLGLGVREDPTLGTFVLEGEAGRIVFVAGTRVATVAGDRLDLTDVLHVEYGDVPLLEADAIRISTAWNGALRRMREKEAALRKAAAPPPPPPAADSAVPSDPQWRIPLKRRWSGILIHHSATESGNMESFDRSHRDRGWLMVGYDFIINNGNGGPDGLVETSDRWRQQIQGAHAGPGLKEYNEHWVGICLVGNFNRGRPTARQLASLRRLVAYLQDRCGIPDGNVRFHRDIRDTDCPGENFPVDDVRRSVRAR